LKLKNALSADDADYTDDENGTRQAA